MAKELAFKRNCTYLITKLSNIRMVKAYLLEADIFGQDELEKFDNHALIWGMMKKDLDTNFEKIIEIFKNTNNEHLVARIEETLKNIKLEKQSVKSENVKIERKLAKCENAKSPGTTMKQENVKMLGKIVKQENVKMRGKIVKQEIVKIPGKTWKQENAKIPGKTVKQEHTKISGKPVQQENVIIAEKTVREDSAPIGGETIKREYVVEAKNTKWDNVTIGKSIKFNCESLELNNCKYFEDGKEVSDISNSIGNKVKVLRVTCEQGTQVKIKLNCLEAIECVNLTKVRLMVESPIKKMGQVREIGFDLVAFFENQEEVRPMLINRVAEFKKLEKLKLIADRENIMSVDLSDACMIECTEFSGITLV